MSSLDKFTAVVEQVRSLLEPRRGCPWHLDQSPSSLAPYIVEEAFELVEALEVNPNKKQDSRLRSDKKPGAKVAANQKASELGDLLFQVLLQIAHAEKQKEFSFDEVFQKLSTKIVERHPHVFSAGPVSGPVSGPASRPASRQVQGNEDAQRLKANWERRKLGDQSFKEFFGSKEFFLPALLACHKIGKKSEAIQFDWKSWQEVLVKYREEFEELEIELKALTKSKGERQSVKIQQRVFEELGDTLFTLAQLARHLDINPETCLRKANRKFLTRLQSCIGNKSLSSFSKLSLVQKEKLWSKAKLKD